MRTLPTAMVQVLAPSCHCSPNASGAWPAALAGACGAGKADRTAALRAVGLEHERRFAATIGS